MLKCARQAERAFTLNRFKSTWIFSFYSILFFPIVLCILLYCSQTLRSHLQHLQILQLPFISIDSIFKQNQLYSILKQLLGRDIRACIQSLQHQLLISLKMMLPDPNNSNPPTLAGPKLPIKPPTPPSISSSRKSSSKAINNNNNDEEEEKWRHMTERHHQHCDFTKCAGKRINGLYVCQFSNIPGSQYNQYLRHRRRQSAYKTKPCRNQYSNGYCHAGDQCPFYHNAEEQQKVPETDLIDSLMVGGGSAGYITGSNSSIDSGGGGNFHYHQTATSMAMGGHHFHQPLQRQRQQQPSRMTVAEESMHKMLDGLNKQANAVHQKLCKHVLINNEFILSKINDSIIGGGGGQRRNSNGGGIFAGLEQQQRQQFQQRMSLAKQQHQQIKDVWKPFKSPPTMTANELFLTMTTSRTPTTPKVPTAIASAANNAPSDAAARAAAALRNAIVAQKNNTNAVSNSSNWEDCSVDNIDGGVGNHGGRALSPVANRFSRAVGAGHIHLHPEQQLQRGNNSADNFARSFHPFSESYPLKNLQTTSDGSGSAVNADVDPLTPMANQQQQLAPPGQRKAQ